MMADIYEPAPTPRSMVQSPSEKKPLFTTLVTMIVGFAAVTIGLIFVGLSSFLPYVGFLTFFMLIGYGNALLGLVDIYVGFRIWNWNYGVRYLGIVANIGLIVLNFLFLIIGILGLVLILVSILTLLLLDTSS